MAEAEHVKLLVAEMAKAGVKEILAPPRRSWSSVLAVVFIAGYFLIQFPVSKPLTAYLMRRSIQVNSLEILLLILSAIFGWIAMLQQEKRGRFTGGIIFIFAAYSLLDWFFQLK